MFDKPHVIQNSFNVIFPRQAAIRRKANDFEDKLKGLYFQPQIISVPDELDPEIPRIIFGSEHGYSQVIISQVSFVLNVVYSTDWQTDISKGKQYLYERVSVLFDLIKLLEGITPYFCGLSTKVQIASSTDDTALLKHIAKLFLKDENIEGVHDLQYKRNSIVSNRFYNNITLNNYRSWKLGTGQQGVLRLSSKEAITRGIEIVGDFNDRYKFNEEKDYNSSVDVAQTVIDGGITEVENVIKMIGGVSA
jgi:hypothetical protein